MSEGVSMETVGELASTVEHLSQSNRMYRGEIEMLRKTLDEKDLQISAARDLVQTCLLGCEPTRDRTFAVARALLRGVLR